MRKDNHDGFVLFIIGFIPVVWLSLKIAPYIDGGLLNALPYISEAMNSKSTENDKNEENSGK